MNSPTLHRSPVWLCALGVAALLFSTGAGAQDVRRELAALRADVGVLNENMRKLHASQESLKEDNRQLRTTVQSLLTRANALADENRFLDKQLSELRTALAGEREARRQMADKLVESVSSEVERIVTSHSERRSTQRAQPNTGTAPSDIPIQGRYTVVRGDTLSAIAAAFDISVKRLKGANNLTSDLIREGQVLNIPEPE